MRPGEEVVIIDLNNQVIANHQDEIMMLSQEEEDGAVPSTAQ